MGIEDRDYMRDRRRAEARLDGAKGGPWFDGCERGLDYRHGRYRAGAAPAVHPAQKWLLLLSALAIGIPLYGSFQRGGWFPDLHPGMPFPESGSVTVERSLDLDRVTSQLEVRTGDANAIVQFFELSTDRHVMSVYAGKHDRVRVPVPSGTYRVRLIEGQKWHGTTRFFGPNTSYETVVLPMAFPTNGWRAIDLNRRFDGNLPTRPMLSQPPHL